MGEGLIYLVARILQFGSYILVLPVVTRLLSQEEVGVVALATLVFQALLGAASLGLTTVVAFPIYERAADGHHRAAQMLTASAAISTAIIAAAHLAGPWWARGGLGGYGPAMQLAVWMALPMSIQSGCLSVLQAQRRSAAFVLSTLVSTIGGQLLGLLLLWGRATPGAYFVGLLVGAVAGCLVSATLAKVTPRRLPSRTELSAALRHGSPTVVHTLAAIVLSAGDRVILADQLGLTAAARYQVAYSLATAGFSLTNALNNAWAPHIFSESEERRWITLADSSVRVAVLVAGSAGALGLAAPLALRFAAPPTYQPDELVHPVAIILGSMLFEVRYLSGMHVLFWTKRTASLALIQPASAMVNIALNLLLIRTFGLSGAALATLAGYATAGLMSRAAARRVADVPWQGRNEAMVFVVSAIVLVIAGFAPGGGLPLALRLVAAVAIGAVLLRLIQAELRRENREVRAGLGEPG